MNAPSSHPNRHPQLDPFVLAAPAAVQRPALPRDEIGGYAGAATAEFPAPCAAAEVFGCVDWFCYPKPPGGPARSHG